MSIQNESNISQRSYNSDPEHIDIMYSYSHQNDVQLLQKLLKSSPTLQRELAQLYEQQQMGDGFEDEFAKRLRLRRTLNDSMGSLTDSDVYNSDGDQQRNNVSERLSRYYSSDMRDNVQADVAISLTRVGRLLEMLSNLPWPRMSFTAMGICFLIATFISPRACVQNILFPTFRLVFGTLYPAYASYKAVRTKNVKEYVKWMMYWIVFAFFTCIETFTDIFLSWLPLYYEVKVIVVLWLLNPATKGSSVLYRKFVHPMLTRREQEIDEYLNQAKERGYTAVIQLGSKGVNYATNVIMQTALKGGGNLVQTIKRSYSLSDLSEPDVHRTQDEIDEITRPQHRGLRPRTQVGRSSSSGARHSTGMYFSEIDVVAAKGPVDSLHYNIKSSDDISSGYSSAEPISGGLSRTSSMTSSKGLRFRAKKPEDENFSENDENEYIKREIFLSQSQSPCSNSLNESCSDVSAIMAFSKDNSIKDNVNSEATNLNTKSEENILENQKELVFVDSEIKFDTSKALDHNKESLSFSLDVNPELRSKFEMFCEWLEKSEIEKNYQQSNQKVDIQRQLSDDNFKDTISFGSNDDRSLDNFDDAICTEIKTSDNISERNSIEFGVNTVDNSSELINESTKNEFPEQTLKENISIAEESVTKLKEHILKFHDEMTNLDQKKEQNNLELLEKSNEEQNLETNINDVHNEIKKCFNTGKGKAPDPPLNADNNIILAPKISSPTMTSFNLIDISPASEITLNNCAHSTSVGTTALYEHDFLNPASSRTSVLHDLNTETSRQLQATSSCTNSSKSRSPSPKPILKTKRNIFRNYLPSIFRSESPKPRDDEECPGKETEI